MHPTGLLSHFTGTPRPVQEQILEHVEGAYSGYDVLVLRMPVGAGKSRVAHCVASWQGQGAILTPTNTLVDQYLSTWPKLVSIRTRSSYSSEDWDLQKALFKGADLKVTNYHKYLAHRAYSRLVVFDEAHNLVGHLQEMEGVKIWPHLKPAYSNARTVADVYNVAVAQKDAKLQRLLSRHPDTFIVRWNQEWYRGREQDCLKVIPLTPRNNRPVFWPPSRVKKMVFLTATFDQEDLYDLGLEGRRVKFLDAESPIPAANRPVVYDPVGSLGYGHRRSTLPKLEAYLTRLLQDQPGKGLVHCTYELAAQLRAGPLGSHPRLRWHTPETRNVVYAGWRRAESDAVLVGCAMSEGLDLADDACRWQVVTKINFLNLTDPAVAAKLKLRPRWYQWQAVKHLEQAVGRVSRHPGDYGITWVVDSDFGRLWRQAQELFTPSFKEALVWAGGL